MLLKIAYCFLTVLLTCTVVFGQDNDIVTKTNAVVAEIDADTSLKRIELLRVKGKRQVLAYLDQKGNTVKITEYYEKNDLVTSTNIYYNWMYPRFIKQSTHHNAKNKSSIPEVVNVYFDEYGSYVSTEPKNLAPNEEEMKKLVRQTNAYVQLTRKKLLFNPFKTFKFDKVEGFSLKHGEHWELPEMYPALLAKSKVEKTGKVLTKNQVASLTKMISDTSSFTGNTAACFEPGMAFAFYKNNALVAVMPVCMGCNRVGAFGFDIPAHRFNQTADCASCNGFSDEARKKLFALCAALKLQDCRNE